MGRIGAFLLVITLLAVLEVLYFIESVLQWFWSGGSFRETYKNVKGDWYE